MKPTADGSIYISSLSYMLDKNDCSFSSGIFSIGQGVKVISCMIGILGRLGATSKLTLSISLMDAYPYSVSAKPTTIANNVKSSPSG